MADNNNNRPFSIEIDVPADVETGMFADFASLWHTPNTFVIDFLSVKRPSAPPQGDEPTAVPVKVGARVRIPPEQIFPLIESLKTQSQQWLQETGRSEPPASWMPDAGR